MGNMTTLQILQGVHDWVLDKIGEETANFITETVNDLLYYYTKSETYTKAEVQQIVDAIKQFTYEVVQVLPTASASTMNKIYLVPAPKSEDKNVKEEYITIQDGSTYSWEMLGTTSIDLSNYYTKGQTDSAISSALSNALASYTTTADLTTLLAQKQDVIRDLSDIRAGASAGSTAVQPSTLNNAVKDVVAESGVYDVSANNDNTKFESLSALLSSANLNTLIPTDIRKGGMSIKFVQSSDNNYIQYRLMADEFTTDVTQWQGVDSELTAVSRNLVENGAVTDGIQGADILVNGVENNINVGWIHPNNGKFIKNQGEGFVFKVNAGDTLKVIATNISNKKTIFALLKDNVYKYGIVSYCDDYSSIISLNADEESEITIPSDCHYVQFGQVAGDSATYKFPKSVIINGFDVTKTIYQNIKTVINKEAADYSTLAGRIAPLEKETSAFGNAEFINSFVDRKRLSATVGQTVDIQNPTVAPDWEYAIISCTAGDKFSISAYGGITDFFAWATLDSNNKVLRTSAPSAVEDEIVTIADGETSILIQNRTNYYKSACFKGVSKDAQLNKKIQDLEGLQSDFVFNGLYVRTDLTSYDRYNVIIPSGANPVWTVSGSAGCVIVPLSGVVKTFLRNNHGAVSLIYALLTSNSHTSGQTVDLSEANKQRQGLAHGESIEIEIPTDATYLYIGVYDSSGYYFGNYFDVYLAEEGKVVELDERVSRLEQKDNWNLDCMTYGVDNECYTFWAYPALIHTQKYRNKLIWSWCDNMGYTGAGEYDLDSKALKRRLLKKSDIDDHNMASVTELEDGKILFGYAGGHGYDNKEHFRVTKNKEYVDNIQDEVAVNLGLGPTTYNQTFKIGDIYYIFCRVNRIGWAYFTTQDFITFTTPVHMIVAPTGIQYYMKVAKVTDNPNMLRFVMYANASIHEYTEIRMGYLDVENSKILNADGETVVDTATPSSPISITSFDVIVPRGGDEYCIRLFDLLESSMDDAVVAFARMPISGSTSSGFYYVYHSKTDTEYVVEGCGIEWIASRAPGGIAFIRETKVVVSKGIGAGNWRIAIYVFIEGSWVLNKVIYSEDTSSKVIKITNKSPIVSTDGKYLMWLRGWYGNYMPSVQYPVPFETNLKMYDIDNDEILF